MSNNSSIPEQKDTSRRVIHIILQVGVLAFILGWCFKILTPFLLPVIWALIISITVYPMFQKLKSKLGDRGKLASIIITVGFLALLIIPTLFLAGSLVEGVRGLKGVINEGQSLIPPPGERAKSLPSFAQPMVEIWQQASDNLQDAVIKYNEQFKAAGLFILSLLASTSIGLLYLLISIIIAGIFLAYAKEGGDALRNIFIKLAGRKGAELASVSEATIRSVVKGILGVAIIQTLLAGIGFVVVGVPAAGLWTFFCLVLAVVQIGVGPIMVLAIIYVFNTSDLTTGIIFLVWGILIMLSDNILKPILLGRGAPVPMLVVFLGAIGGFIAVGFLGLFVGAVILSLGYKLYESWMAEDSGEKTEVTE